MYSDDSIAIKNRRQNFQWLWK